MQQIVPQLSLLPGICTVKDIDCGRAVSSSGVLVARRQVRGKVPATSAAPHRHQHTILGGGNLFKTPLRESLSVKSQAR